MKNVNKFNLSTNTVNWLAPICNFLVMQLNFI